MDDNPTDLELTDRDALDSEVSDEALEAAAGTTHGAAMYTLGTPTVSVLVACSRHQPTIHGTHGPPEGEDGIEIEGVLLSGWQSVEISVRIFPVPAVGCARAGAFEAIRDIVQTALLPTKRTANRRTARTNRSIAC
jgi:hypothetical protein